MKRISLVETFGFDLVPVLATCLGIRVLYAQLYATIWLLVFLPQGVIIKSV